MVGGRITIGESHARKFDPWAKFKTRSGTRYVVVDAKHTERFQYERGYNFVEQEGKKVQRGQNFLMAQSESKIETREKRYQKELDKQELLMGGQQRTGNREIGFQHSQTQIHRV